MNIKPVSDISAAIADGQTLKYVYIREYSRVFVGNTPVTLNEDEIIEVRFFEPGKEIRIFNNRNVLTAAEISEEEGDIYLEKSQKLLNQEKFGDSICIRDYLEPDEDGQMCVSETCLSSWKGVAETV